MLRRRRADLELAPGEQERADGRAATSTTSTIAKPSQMSPAPSTRSVEPPGERQQHEDSANTPNTAPAATAAAPRAMLDDLHGHLGLGELDLLADEHATCARRPRSARRRGCRSQRARRLRIRARTRPPAKAAPTATSGRSAATAAAGERRRRVGRVAGGGAGGGRRRRRPAARVARRGGRRAARRRPAPARPSRRRARLAAVGSASARSRSPGRRARHGAASAPRRVRSAAPTAPGLRRLAHSGGSSPKTRIQITAASARRGEAGERAGAGEQAGPHQALDQRALSHRGDSIRLAAPGSPPPASARRRSRSSPRQIVSTISVLARSSSASPTGALSKIQPVSTCSIEP